MSPLQHKVTYMSSGHGHLWEANMLPAPANSLIFEGLLLELKPHFSFISSISFNNLTDIFSY